MANIIPAESSNFDTAGSTGAWEAWFSSTVAQSTVEAADGTGSMAITATDPFAAAFTNNFPGFPAAPGTYALSIKAKGPSGATFTFTVQWRLSDGTVLSEDSTGVSPTSSGFTTYQMESVAPADTEAIHLILNADGTATTDATYYFDTLIADDASTPSDVTGSVTTTLPPPVGSLSGHVETPPATGAINAALPIPTARLTDISEAAAEAFVVGAESTSGNSDLVCPVPTDTADGDVMVAFESTDWDSYAEMTAPAGWNLLTGFDNGQDNVHVKIWYRVAASEPSSYTFTQGTSSDGTVTIVSQRGVTDAFVTDIVGTDPAGTSRECPSLSGVTAGSVLLCFAMLDANATTITWTPPPGMTEQADVQSNTWTTSSVASLLNPPDPTGVRTFTSSTGGNTTFERVGVQASVAAIPYMSSTVSGALAADLPALTGGLTGEVQEPSTGGAVDAVLPTLAGSFTATSDASTGPFVAGVSGLHFVDENGEPILIKGDTVWAFPVNAGRWNGGDWPADIESYMSARATQGYNALYIAALGSTQNNGPSDDGATFDGVLPFVGGDPGILNDSYWGRVDYILSQAETHGITVFLDFAYSSDLNNAALSGKTDTQFTGYGTALASRYVNRRNLVWMIGGDYFGTFDTQLTNTLNAIRAAGDTHIIAAENYSMTTSRRDIFNDSVQAWGDEHAQFNFVYTYNVTYVGVEYAYAEASPLAVLWGDGHYDQDTAADRHLMRNLTWWALSSGARGTILGTEAIWGWPSGGLDAVSSEVFGATDLPTIRDTFTGLRGWHMLLPDTDSSLVTGGRGTHADPLPSGGGGDEYDATDPQDTYVTASVTPDGTLAVIYMPVVTTITVDDTELLGGYTTTWIDPVTGTATPATVDSTYANPGTNSIGDDDWVLVFESSGVKADIGASLPGLTGQAAGTVENGGQLARTRLPALTSSLTGALTDTGQVAATLPVLTGSLSAAVLPDATGSMTATLPALIGGLGGALVKVDISVAIGAPVLKPKIVLSGPRTGPTMSATRNRPLVTADPVRQGWTVGPVRKQRGA